jgi:hypothetical protein
MPSRRWWGLTMREQSQSPVLLVLVIRQEDVEGLDQDAFAHLWGQIGEVVRVLALERERKKARSQGLPLVGEGES